MFGHPEGWQRWGRLRARARRHADYLGGDQQPLKRRCGNVYMRRYYGSGWEPEGESRVVHGMLVGSYVSTLIGTQLPGPGALWAQQTLRWVAPVFIDEPCRTYVIEL